MILFAVLGLMWSADVSALYLEEEVMVTINGIQVEKSYRSIWVSNKKVRVDFKDIGLRLIYNMDFKTLFVIDMEKRHYYMARPNTLKDRFARLPLSDLGVMLDDRLENVEPILTKTGNTLKISGWTCQEMRLASTRSGNVQTSIWVTQGSVLNQKLAAEPRFLRQIWEASLGINPPFDVVRLIRRVFEAMDGIPLRVVTTVNQDDLEVVTTSTLVDINREYDKPGDFFDIPADFDIIQSRKPIENRPGWSDQIP